MPESGRRPQHHKRATVTEVNYFLCPLSSACDRDAVALQKGATGQSLP